MFFFCFSKIFLFFFSLSLKKYSQKPMKNVPIVERPKNFSCKNFFSHKKNLKPKNLWFGKKSTENYITHHHQIHIQKLKQDRDRFCRQHRTVTWILTNFFRNENPDPPPISSFIWKLFIPLKKKIFSHSTIIRWNKFHSYNVYVCVCVILTIHLSPKTNQK